MRSLGWFFSLLVVVALLAPSFQAGEKNDVTEESSPALYSQQLITDTSSNLKSAQGRNIL